MTQKVMYEVCSGVITAPTYCGIYLVWLEQSRNLGRRYNQDCKYPWNLNIVFFVAKHVFKTPVTQIFPRACQCTGQLLTVFSFYYTSTVSGVSPVHGHFKGGRSVQTWAFLLQVPLGCD